MRRGRKSPNLPDNDVFTKYPVWAEEHWMYFKSAMDVPKIRTPNRLIGFVYVVEYGEMIKIGFTEDPRERFSTKYKPALNYGYEPGRIFISPAHRHYVDTEHALHKHFADFRVPKTELFKIKFSENIPVMMCMALELKMFEQGECDTTNTNNVKEEREISMNNQKVNNADIRNEMKAAGLYYWQIAAKLGIAESTFIRWLRFELSDELKADVRAAIKELEEERE